MSELAYPLQWPAGWPRSSGRDPGVFKGTLDKIRKELLNEIDLIALGMDARYRSIRNQVVISTNMPLRQDGEIHGGRPEPMDCGVAVYFERKGQRICMACDKYDRVWKNLRAIQRSIEALRGIERWGSSQLLDRAFTGFAALPGKRGPNCWETLGVCAVEPTEEEVLAAFRAKAKTAHPDAGGSAEEFAALSEAKDIALATIRMRRAAA